jgi:N-acetylmuramoyl-L-alanine amidase
MGGTLTQTLNRRADRANDLHADIFLSIHHDGARDDAVHRWTYKGELRYFFDDSKGFSLHVSPRNPRYQESLGLARILADHLMQRGLQFTAIHAEPNGPGARVPFVDPTRGIYRRDDLVVLRATEMPAVLLEGGVIVNREEELLVSTAAYQTLIASVVVESIKAFCRGPQSSAYKVSGVAANDVLNIRSGPDANSAIVGTIPPNGREVRMIGNCAGSWCRIEYRGTQGWANRRFLVDE